MHDTRLHTEPEELFFVNLFNAAVGKRVFDRIIVRPSPQKEIDGTRIESIYFTDYELTDINNGLYDEPSKSTDK